MESDSEKLKPVFHPLKTPIYHKIVGYDSNDSYAWASRIDQMVYHGDCLKEEQSYDIYDWNYEELESSLNNYNVRLIYSQKRINYMVSFI